MKNNLDVVGRLRSYGVIPVIRTATGELALKSIEWLTEAGYRTFEVTLTIPGAIDLIAELSSRPDLLIGAGTVLDAASARAVIAAGACYVVTPCVLPEIGEICQAAGVPPMMGALSPTEVLSAWRAGSAIVKIFPASTVGPGHLRALKSIYPDIPLMPTGGIDTANVSQWVSAGADCVGVGGKLVDNRALSAGDRAGIIAAARELLAAYNQARDDS